MRFVRRGTSRETERIWLDSIHGSNPSGQLVSRYMDSEVMCQKNPLPEAKNLPYITTCTLFGIMGVYRVSVDA